MQMVLAYSRPTHAHWRLELVYAAHSRVSLCEGR